MNADARTDELMMTRVSSLPVYCQIDLSYATAVRRAKNAKEGEYILITTIYYKLARSSRPDKKQNF